MAWDDSLQLFGAEKEMAYLKWAARDHAEDEEVDDKRLGTKAGYVDWIGDDEENDPAAYRKARAEFETAYDFPAYFADRTWKAGPVKCKKKNKPALPLFTYGGLNLPDTVTYRDSAAEGGFRTFPMSDATVGQYDRDVADREAEHEAEGVELAAERAAVDLMKEEVGGDLSVRVSKIAAIVAAAMPSAEPVE